MDYQEKLLADARKLLLHHTDKMVFPLDFNNIVPTLYDWGSGLWTIAYGKWGGCIRPLTLESLVDYMSQPRLKEVQRGVWVCMFTLLRSVWYGDGTGEPKTVRIRPNSLGWEGEATFNNYVYSMNLVQDADTANFRVSLSSKVYWHICDNLPF
jgi:hypothetical protein